MNHGSELPAWLWALFPFFFVGMWVTVSLLLSLIGGWRALARQYPAPEPAEGTWFPFCSATVGWVNYNGCLNLRASPAGLRIAVLLPFRLGHPPFFVPWRDLSGTASRRFFVKTVTFRFSGAPDATFEVAHRLAADLATASGGALVLPPLPAK